MLVDVLRQWSDRESLQAHLAAHFKLDFKNLQFGATSLAMVAVANPHSAMDSLMGDVVDGDYQWEPFWAQAWPSAERLGTWLADHPNAIGSLMPAVEAVPPPDSVLNSTRWQPNTAVTSHPSQQGERVTPLPSGESPDWSGHHVLDLGCGVGLCGCLAASWGASVVLADYAPPSMEFAAWNAWPWRDRVKSYVIDWHRDKIPEKFSIIIGADIVYEQRNWDAIETFLRSHLAPGGHVILTEPGRDTGVGIQPFLRDRRWTLNTSTLAILDNHRPLRLIIATDAGQEKTVESR